ncbi:MAG: hypothetical protein LC689_22465, partial [Myxococcales bacterium]|nr:hypothetical protein [Myxococcales bacterium]
PARACGAGYRTPPYQNLLPLMGLGGAGAGALFLIDLTPASSDAPALPSTQLALAGTNAVAALSIAFTNDARADGARPALLGVAAVSALLAVHAAWALLKEDGTEKELSFGTGVGRSTLGATFGLRRDGFGGHVGIGAPTAMGYGGVSAGVSHVGQGPVALLWSLNLGLQTLPDRGAGYSYGFTGQTAALFSTSFDLGARVRLGSRAFLDIAVGPVLQAYLANDAKSWRNPDPSHLQLGAGMDDLQNGGAWPIPIDLSIGLGVAL